MSFYEYAQAATNLRSSQRFCGNNPGWAELLDSRERAKENMRLISEMRSCGLKAGDSFDAMAWILSPDGYRTTEQLFRPIVAEYAKDSELASKLAAIEAKIGGNETSPDSRELRVTELVELMRLDRKLATVAQLKTKQGERKTVYGRIQAAKQKQTSLYDEAKRRFEKDLAQQNCPNG